MLSGSLAAIDAAPPSVVVSQVDRAQQRIVAWAVDRYRRVGLELPPLEVHFHPSPGACAGNSGLSLDARIDLCTGTTTIAYARATLLHEMAHAWLEQHATPELRARFLPLLGLSTWSSRDVPWYRRGVEQAAAILAWGLGDGSLRTLAHDDDPGALTVAFRSLTGRPPLSPEAVATP